MPTPNPKNATLVMTFRERENLVYALGVYRSYHKDRNQLFNVDSIIEKLSHLPCGDRSCQYCGDEPYYPEDYE